MKESKIKNLNERETKSELYKLKGRLKRVNATIEFDRRYRDKAHLLSDLAIEKDNIKRKILLLESHQLNLSSLEVSEHHLRVDSSKNLITSFL